MATELEMDSQKENQNVSSLLNETLYQKNQSRANLNRFQKLFSFFSSKMIKKEINETPEIKEVSLAVLAQQKQASQFLNNQMYDAYTKMLTYGYQPTSEQKQNFDSYAKSLLHYDANDYYGEHYTKKRELEKYLSIGYRFDKKEMLEYILQTTWNEDKTPEIKEAIAQLKDPQAHFEPSALREALKETFSDSNFSQDFFKHCIHAIKGTLNPYSGKALQNYHQNLRLLYRTDADLLLKDISFDDMMSFVQLNITCFSIIYEAYHHGDCGYKEASFNHWARNIMPEFIEEHYSLDMERRLQQTKETFRGELENLALKQARQSIEHQSVKSLPKEVKEKISEIENIYWNLKNSHKKGENPQQDFDMQNLFEKRIPEVLEKYIRIPEEYRAKTQHETTGKTAYEMMMESLDNYQQKLQALLDEKIQHNLSDMNATKIYSKKIM